MKILSSDIHIFSRLPGKVRLLCLARFYSNLLLRTLLATIRNMGGCPCPRCLIPLSRVHNLGKPKDMKDRRIHPRIDNVFRGVLIDSSRKSIYNFNRPVNSTIVEDSLKPQSYVPTRVSQIPLYTTTQTKYPILECLFQTL